MKPAGLIIAGGRSRRFGTEKALAEVAGQPMIAHVAEVLRPACCALAVNAPRGGGAAAWAQAAGLPLVSDAPDAPESPLAGVLAGLAWAAGQGAELLATVPCDSPWLPPDLVFRLLAALTPQAGCAVAAVGADLHPVCALWRVTGAADLAARAGGPRHPPLRHIVVELGAAVAQFDDARAFANVNTPADLAHRLDDDADGAMP